MAGRMINGAAALAELIRAAGEIDAPGAHRMLPVAPELSALLPGRGLRRGSTIAVTPSGPAQAGHAAEPWLAEPAGRAAQAGQTAEAGPAGRMVEAGLAGQTAEAGPAGRMVEAGLAGRTARVGHAAEAGSAAQAGGATSLLLALLSEASRAGSWCAVVGVPSLGALAAAESGIALDRLALVPDPGPDWPTVVAALIDGVDVVVAAVPGSVAPTIAARLVARARQRGCVLVPFGHWTGADVTLQVTAGRWEGLGPGRGRLRRREVTVLARGRGAAARPKEITFWMPGVTTRHPPLPPAPSTADPPPDFGPLAPDPPTPGPSPSVPFAFAPPPARPSARLPPADRPRVNPRSPRQSCGHVISTPIRPFPGASEPRGSCGRALRRPDLDDLFQGVRDESAAGPGNSLRGGFTTRETWAHPASGEEKLNTAFPEPSLCVHAGGLVVV